MLAGADERGWPQVFDCRFVAEASVASTRLRTDTPCPPVRCLLSLQRSRTALGAAFRRTARYKGGAVAIFVIARKLAIVVYRMLRYGQDYVDLGEVHYEAWVRQRRLDGLRHTAQALGYTLIAPTDGA